MLRAEIMACRVFKRLLSSRSIYLELLWKKQSRFFNTKPGHFEDIAISTVSYRKTDRLPDARSVNLGIKHPPSRGFPLETS